MIKSVTSFSSKTATLGLFNLKKLILRTQKFVLTKHQLSKSETRLTTIEKYDNKTKTYFLIIFDALKLIRKRKLT